jgi:hypothetical protein
MLGVIMEKFTHGYGTYAPNDEQKSMYKELDATQLYCPKCQQAVPVRKRLLLVLPEGDKYEYRCAFCGESVGYKMDKSTPQQSILY